MQSLRTYFDVRQTLQTFLEEDIGKGDLTSRSIIAENIEVRGEIVHKGKTGSILAGIKETEMIFDICRCKCRALCKDGDRLDNGAIVLNVLGDARSILKAERTALNLLMRMSGIATETRRIVDSVGSEVKILATRKTVPGLRFFDKKAVVVGGGSPHRVRLDDMVLIKDNHIGLVGGASECVSRARESTGPLAKLECEVSNAEEALSAIRAGANIVMLDNFTPMQAAHAIRKIKNAGLRKNVKIEISGGIRPGNIKKYAKLGIDYISMGYLTHSPKAIDFSLEILNR